VTIVPTGDGGGDSNKTLRTVLQIVVLVVAAAVSLIVPVGRAGEVVLAGSLTAFAIGMLLPPTPPRRPDQDSAARFAPSISGARNQLRPFGVCAKVLGRARVFPSRPVPIAA
jgi:hypothetical protein